MTAVPETLPEMVPLTVDVRPARFTVVGKMFPVTLEPFWVSVMIGVPELIHVPVTDAGVVTGGVVTGGVVTGGVVAGGVVVVGVVVVVVVVEVEVVVVGAVGDDLLPPHAATVIAKIKMGAIRIRNIIIDLTDTRSLFPTCQW